MLLISKSDHQQLVKQKSNLMDQLLQQCQNCKKQISQDKMATHFSYCRRNIKICIQCGHIYDINYVQVHNQQFHKQQHCQFCNCKIEKSMINRHQQQCMLKPIYCQFCQLIIPRVQYKQHTKLCQSRTNTCQKCGKNIILKNYFSHIKICSEPPMKQLNNLEKERQDIKNINKQNSQQPERSREKPTKRNYKKNIQKKSNSRFKPIEVYQISDPESDYDQNKQKSQSNFIQSSQTQKINGNNKKTRHIKNTIPNNDNIGNCLKQRARTRRQKRKQKFDKGFTKYDKDKQYFNSTQKKFNNHKSFYHEEQQLEKALLLSMKEASNSSKNNKDLEIDQNELIDFDNDKQLVSKKRKYK